MWSVWSVCVHRHLYHSGKDLYHSVKVVWVQGRMRFDVGWVQGSYFADDAGKIDQYVVKDERHNAASPLHQVLTFSSPFNRHDSSQTSHSAHQLMLRELQFPCSHSSDGLVVLCSGYTATAAASMRAVFSMRLFSGTC